MSERSKRGGGRSPISIDQFQCEDWLRLEPFHELTPDRIFLREWATTLLHRVMTTLQAEAYRKGKARLFDRIRPTLLGREASPCYAEIASDLGMSDSNIKVAVHRYRSRNHQSRSCSPAFNSLEDRCRRSGIHQGIPEMKMTGMKAPAQVVVMSDSDLWASGTNMGGMSM